MTNQPKGWSPSQITAAAAILEKLKHTYHVLSIEPITFFEVEEASDHVIMGVRFEVRVRGGGSEPGALRQYRFIIDQPVTNKTDGLDEVYNMQTWKKGGNYTIVSSNHPNHKR